MANVALKFEFPDRERDPLHYGVREEELQRRLPSLWNEALTMSRLKSFRNEAKTVRIICYRQEIVKGVIKDTKLGEKTLPLPLLPRTEEEFNADMVELLKVLPEQFHSFIVGRSWDEGHHAGHDEVISIAQDLVNGLQPCVENYKRSFS